METPVIQGSVGNGSGVGYVAIDYGNGTEYTFADHFAGASIRGDLALLSESSPLTGQPNIGVDALGIGSGVVQYDPYRIAGPLDASLNAQVIQLVYSPSTHNEPYSFVNGPLYHWEYFISPDGMNWTQPAANAGFAEQFLVSGEYEAWLWSDTAQTVPQIAMEPTVPEPGYLVPAMVGLLALRRRRVVS